MKTMLLMTVREPGRYAASAVGAGASSGCVFEGNARGVAVVGCTGLDLRGDAFRNFSGEPYELVNVTDVKRD